MGAKGKIVEVRGLKKVLDGQPILRGIHLEARRGETLVIMGRSGCGKTVLLKHIIGLMRPDEGRVMVDGVDITRLPERALNRERLKFGMLFQEGALFDSMTVFENVGFALIEHTDMSREAVRGRVSECLRHVGLEGIEGMTPESLSGGMKKRVGLARAIAMNPEIILYDEPTSGVDPVMGSEINALIRKLGGELGAASLVVTHSLEDALELGDRIVLLERGVIVASGTPAEFARGDHHEVRKYLNRGATQPG